MNIANDSVLAHHRAAALMWGQGGSGYDDISFGLSDALAHAAQRLSARPDEEILDLPPAPAGRRATSHAPAPA
jgi:hypothetical protein